MLTTADAIRSRRAVRGFLPQAVPEITMREIFALAQWAPSNCNTQPWIVHVASGASCNALRQRLSQAALDPACFEPDFPYAAKYEGVYRERQYDSAARLYTAMEITRDDKLARERSMLRNFVFFDAPHVAFVFLHERHGLREAMDCGMYAQTLMLAMAGHGVASCPQTALSLHPRIVREELRVEVAHRLLFGISFGYEDPAVKANVCRTDRADLDKAVSFHR
jgi:hypothetical protein